MSLIRNERIKLTVGLLNTVSGFSLTAGGLGPLIAISYGITGNTPPLGFGSLLLIAGVWLTVGTGLHLFARWLLGKLQP